MSMDDDLSTSRPRPRVSRSAAIDLGNAETRKRDLDRGRSLIARLAGLEAATEQAAHRLSSGASVEALAAWCKVALAAESLFGADDAAVVDAMRIAASVMNRIGMHSESDRVLCDAIERTIRSEGPDSDRYEMLRDEVERSRAITYETTMNDD